MHHTSFSPELTRENSKSQRERILARLIAAHGEWVDLPSILPLAAQYSARIHELRKLGFRIENKTERVNRERHSWFRLLTGAPAQSDVTRVKRFCNAAVTPDVPRSAASCPNPLLLSIPNSTSLAFETGKKHARR